MRACRLRWPSCLVKRSAGSGARLFGALLLVLLPALRAQAQPVIDQFVSGADLLTVGNCSLLRVNFHLRVRYTGHVPEDRGSQLRVSLQVIDREAIRDRRLSRREGIRVSNPGAAALQSAFLVLDEADGPVLLLEFAQPVAFQVLQSGSFETIAIAIAKKGSMAVCKPLGIQAKPADMKDRTLRGQSSDNGAAPREDRLAIEKQAQGDVRSVEAALDEARAAIRKGAFVGAIDILRRALKHPENPSSAEARELLGVALQKSGRTEEARAAFEDYLQRYPSGEGSDRVRQRLAALLTATGIAPPKLSGAPDAGGASMPKKGQPTGDTRWMLAGSLSTQFITNDSTSTVKDLTIAPNPNADPDAHRTHLNTILTNYDMFGSADNDQVRTKFKLSMTEEHQLDTRNDRLGVSTAQVDYTVKDYDVTARVGRQSRNSGGVLGRFDGAVLSWDQSPSLRFNVLAGSPNWSRFDAPFLFGKTMYGASVDFAKAFGWLDMTLYAIEQLDHSLVDRQAIGAEFRYFDRNKSALGTIDYDVHFQRLNAAIFSGTYTFDDNSVLNTSLDYRKVPFLSSWNALQGQPFLTLYDMLKNGFTARDIRQLAVDRTPTFESAMVSYTRPLNATYQIGADATVTHLTGTLPSGGVDGTPATGLEYYLSTQLIGNSIFKPGDLAMVALRYAHLSDSNIYALDINTRYPITPDLSISPRLRLGYRTGVITDLKETTILPSFLVSYFWSKELSFEAELGYRYVDNRLANIKSTTKDIFATIGIRKDFGWDGVTQCNGAAVSCLWARQGVTQAAGANSGGALMPVKAAPSGVPLFAFEGGLRYWYSSGKNRYNYFADTAATTQVSRLNYSGLTGHTGEMFFRVDALDGPLANLFVKGYVGGGKITGGSLIDEDFAPFVNPSSKTVSNAGGQLQYANIDLGLTLLGFDRYRVGAFVGYHHWLETVDARGCTQQGGNPVICVPALGPGVKVVTEQDRWSTGRAGIAVEARLLDRLSWQGEFAYAWTSLNATDTHYFTFGRDPASGTGSGFQAETILNYRVTDNFSLGIGGRWWHFNTDAVDSFGQLLRYTTDRYGVFVQGSYKFN